MYKKQVFFFNYDILSANAVNGTDEMHPGLMYFNFVFRGGIYIWSASYPANTATLRHGIAPSIGTFSRGSGLKMILVDVLKDRDCPNQVISALSWKPDGKYPFHCL